MKNKEIISAALGGTFFAIPYLALAVPLVPSLIIAGAAFAAGELALTEEKTLKVTNISLFKKIENAKNQIKQIDDMKSKIEDDNIIKYIEEICKSSNKIIETIEKEPKKGRKINNFFDYYLPVTLNIVRRYDEIENQDLSSKNSKEFFKSTNTMIKTINDAFKSILNNLYEDKMIDTDAEMKVFKSILKADGYEEEEDSNE